MARFPTASEATMSDRTEPALDAGLIGQEVVVDLASSYVCLGRLLATDAAYLDLADADLHDFRDSTATREVYVYDSRRFGIRRNRSRVLISRREVVALTRLADILEA
jgi:hypothetical protein